MDDDLIKYVSFSNEEFANENSIDVESQSKSSTWTRSETNKLIEAYEQYKDSFIHVKQRKYAWEMISTHLQALDVMKLAKDCSVKWNNLSRTYKAAKDNKKNTGRRPIRFVFYDMMDAILGTKASNIQDDVGVSIGASTEGLDSISSPNNIVSRPVVGLQQSQKPRKRQISAKEEYYKLKIERLKAKSTNEMELLSFENQKVELLQKLIEKM